MKECSAFICKYSHGNRYNDLICQYSDELCDLPFIDNCGMVDINDLCSVCERAEYCGLKDNIVCEYILGNLTIDELQQALDDWLYSEICKDLE